MCVILALQVRSFVSKIFLAAKSLCTKHFLERYPIPAEISLPNLMKSLGRTSGSSPLLFL